jgi:hypothetical protein
MTINTINSTNTIGITNLIARTLFLDAFIPEFFYKDPIGVSSSISIEFWWSILIPIVIWIRRKKSVIIKLILVTVVSLLNVGSQTIASSLNDYGKFNENRIWDFGIYFYSGNIAWEIFVETSARIYALYGWFLLFCLSRYYKPSAFQQFIKL